MAENLPKMAFTITPSPKGLHTSLRADVNVIANGKILKAASLWDTGATGTCISSDVVSILGLISTGKQKIRTPSGDDIVDTYMVDISLPNNVTIQGVRVCGSRIGDQGLGVLIGMDIITMGDFAVSNFDGSTVFTFRIPSIRKADYVTDARLSDLISKSHRRKK